MSFDRGIRYELDGHVARVTIDRPHVLNAIDRAAHLELRRIWSEIENDTDVRVVVLTGAGDRSFCTGADMSAAGVGKTGMEYWADLDPDGFGALSLRESLDVPVIARVNGYALGGGMEMVLGCDIVVAADTARFGLPEPRIGRLPLDGGMVQLARQLPYHQAMGLLLTGRRAPAEEMQRLGLVNEVVPARDARRRGAAVGGRRARVRPAVAARHQADRAAHRAPERPRGQHRAARPPWSRRCRARTRTRGCAPSRRSGAPVWTGS